MISEIIGRGLCKNGMERAVQKGGVFAKSNMERAM